MPNFIARSSAYPINSGITLVPKSSVCFFTSHSGINPCSEMTMNHSGLSFPRTASPSISNLYPCLSSYLAVTSPCSSGTLPPTAVGRRSFFDTSTAALVSNMANTNGCKNAR
jgi:hypothetical protein